MHDAPRMLCAGEAVDRLYERLRAGAATRA